MRLAIADPPYPPLIGARGTRPRASRWYGDNQLSQKDVPADHHPAAAEWDDPERHRALLVQLLDEFDGFAIATSPDGIAAYAPLPVGIHIMAWHKTNAQPGGHRLHSMWEPVLLFPPVGRRSNRGDAGGMSDVLTCGIARTGFVGSKPIAWTRWVLDAMTYDPQTDEVVDMFPGSGAVSAVLDSPTLALAFGSAS